MPRPLAALPLLGLLILAPPALAAPPSDAKPLSEIIKMLEDREDVAYFEEVEWDDDDGHWDIEYVRPGGDEVEIEVDPVSGQPRS
jgi:hypothetical protein